MSDDFRGAEICWSLAFWLLKYILYNNNNNRDAYIRQVNFYSFHTALLLLTSKCSKCK